jgi:hypothetical protein
MTRRANGGLGELLTPREVGVRLALGKTAVARLIFLGRACRGRHPIWGGLWPVFKLGRARRVPAASVAAHVEHLDRLATDGAFAAVCAARACEARFAGAGGCYRAFTADGSREIFSSGDEAGKVRTAGAGLPCSGRGKRKQGQADPGRRMGLSEGARGLKGARRGGLAAGGARAEEGQDDACAA